jgi:hypothetical protein
VNRRVPLGTESLWRCRHVERQSQRSTGDATGKSKVFSKARQDLSEGWKDRDEMLHKNS